MYRIELKSLKNDFKCVRDKIYQKKIQIAEQTDYIIESDKW